MTILDPRAFNTQVAGKTIDPATGNRVLAGNTIDIARAKLSRNVIEKRRYSAITTDANGTILLDDYGNSLAIPFSSAVLIDVHVTAFNQTTQTTAVAFGRFAVNRAASGNPVAVANVPALTTAPTTLTGIIQGVVIQVNGTNGNVQVVGTGIAANTVIWDATLEIQSIAQA